MKKNYNSLACPYCHGEHGNNMQCKLVEKIEKEENENCTIVTIKRDYDCYCFDCQKKYSVDFGMARLFRYHPFIYSSNDDIKLYVEYESEFDRSYRIIEVQGIPMITMEDDEDPIIINNDTKEELIVDHDKAKSLTYNTWMTRHR